MFTRVFSSILDSSLNVQGVPLSARWLWVTMLLIADADRTGVVDMPVERLAARAGLSVEQTREGLKILGAPDPDSASQDEDGRRIVPIREDSSRGWRLVNWEKYREIANAEQKREQTRERVAAFRDRKKSETEKTPETARHATNETEAIGSYGSDANDAIPHAGLAAIEIVARTVRAIAPEMRHAPDDIEISLWLRDIEPDPWWIAAVLCEAQASLTAKQRTPRYLRSILKNRKEEGQVIEDAAGYVTYFTSQQRASRLRNSVM